MPSHDLSNGGKVVIDIGNSKGVLVTNLRDTRTSVFIDYVNGKDYSPITGEKKLPAGGELALTREQLGHEKIRVAAEGEDDGAPIAKVLW